MTKAHFIVTKILIALAIDTTANYSYTLLMKAQTSVYAGILLVRCGLG
jgi:hypothetical protein